MSETNERAAAEPWDQMAGGPQDEADTAAARADEAARWKKPNLGLATTRELLDEIRARIETDVSGKGLDYRTLDTDRAKETT
jgi:hypothetical protein